MVVFFLESLPEFISRHTAEKMCLPCSLKLPIREQIMHTIVCTCTV